MRKLSAAIFTIALSSRLLAGGVPTPRAEAPQQSAPSPSSSAVSKPSSPVAASNDSAVERAIQARFARSKISTNGFTVRVQAGVAILEGKTGVIQHKGTATRLAKAAGAKRVDNRIQISEAARQKAANNLARVSKH